MVAPKFSAWMLPLMRRRASSPQRPDPAGLGAELGLEMSLSPELALAPSLPRSKEELQALRRRCESGGSQG